MYNGAHAEAEVAQLYRDGALAKTKDLFEASRELRLNGATPQFYRMKVKCISQSFKKFMERFVKRIPTVNEPD